MSLLEVKAMEKLKRLVEVLKRRYPGERADVLAEILALAAERGRIAYEEIECDDETKLDLLLLAYKERLLLPIEMPSTSKSLAWEDVALEARPGEMYEMPNVIRHLILHAEETGEWNPEAAVERYLREIAEQEADKALLVFKGIVEEVSGGRGTTAKVTPETIKEVCRKHCLKIDMNKLIAEFKGGGIMSPSITILRKEGSIAYEVNPSLMSRASSAP
jgi:hypothetical protein